MKTRITITKFIAIMMAFSAMAVTGSIWTTAAQQVRVMDGTTFASIIPAQSLRFNVGNLSTLKWGCESVRAQVKLYDAQGKVIARSQEVEVPCGHFHTFNFDRDDLPLAGEPDTGRLQVRAGIQVLLMDGSVRPVKYFPVSMEVMDNRTGGGPYFTGSVTVSDDGFD